MTMRFAQSMNTLDSMDGEAESRMTVAPATTVNTVNTVNPLVTLATILSTKWGAPDSVAVPCLFHLKLAGVEFNTDEQQATIMTLLHSLGFLQVRRTSSDEGFEVRLNPVYKSKSI